MVNVVSTLDTGPVLDRRELLRFGVLAAGSVIVLGAVPSVLAVPTRPDLVPAGTSLPSMDRFAALVGERFVAVRGGARTTYTLQAVDSIVGRTTAGSATTGEAFSLLFRGPRAAARDGGASVWLHHRAIGTHDYFLAPVGGDDHWEVVVDLRQPTGTEEPRP